MATKKRKYFVNIKEAREVLRGGYGIFSKVINDYHLKLKTEESDIMFDWYHTTGTLMLVCKDFQNNIGTFGDPEDVARIIHKKIDQYENSHVLDSGWNMESRP